MNEETIAQNDLPQEMRLGIHEVYVMKTDIITNRKQTWIYKSSDNRINLDWCDYNNGCSPMSCELCEGGRIENRCVKCVFRCSKPYGNWTWCKDYPKYTEFMGRKV